MTTDFTDGHGSTVPTSVATLLTLLEQAAPADRTDRTGADSQCGRDLSVLSSTLPEIAERIETE